MKYLLIKTNEGFYQDKRGNRYDILECHKATGPRADEFVEFESLDKVKVFYDLVDITNKV